MTTKPTELAKLCEIYSQSLANWHKSLANKQKAIKTLTPKIKQNGPFEYNGYIYKMSNPFIRMIVDTVLLKTKYPDIYKQCLKQSEVKPYLIRIKTCQK